MPIIDPMYLYAIEILHNIDVLNQGLFFTLSILLVCFIGICLFEKEVQQETLKHKRLIICVCSIWVVSLMVAVLVPTKDAMYKMLIAHYVTTDNLQAVNELVKGNIQDYLNMLENTIRNLR
ncbi:MAG: hypothetical protein E7B69_01300 [Veillonella sp.]|jgi:hypothetical protein|nr:hypothetical protein [Veillonella sp.]DAE50063.1 MAG TPA: hypothetical protein [Caudoviricetes sp.]DAE52357.1 MAG TPA: hypothetical protein [Caudoviricetes sp.]